MPPTVSVIVPCYNEEKHIRTCLASIFSFECDWEFEVIVADGMSTDSTRSILAELSKEYPTLRVIDNPRRFIPCALNLLIREAKGEYILLTDAHADYPNNYMKLCVEGCRTTGADNVGGVIMTLPFEDTTQAHLVKAIMSTRMGVGDSAFRVGAAEGPADTVPFGCFPRKLFDEIGYYDERLLRHEDYEFNRRIWKAGGKIWLNPEIQANYYSRPTLKALYLQGNSSAMWDVFSWYLAPYAFSLRHSIPSVFVLAILVSLVIACFSKIGLLLLAVILIPYFLLAILASLQASKESKTKLALILPFCFFGFHVAFGLGGLWGAIILAIGQAPVQRIKEPWPGAGQFRSFPPIKNPANLKTGEG